MQNSQIWWNKTKNDKNKLNAWLLNQAACELQAETKIKKLMGSFGMSKKETKIVDMICEDEGNHATWLLELCLSRGVQPKQVKTTNRYWKKAYKFKNLDEAFGVAAHAEIMSLDRIKTIVNDKHTPKDVRSVFKKILKDEIFHAKAFTHLTTPKSFKKTEKTHKLGMKALGLEL